MRKILNGNQDIFNFKKTLYIQISSICVYTEQDAFVKRCEFMVKGKENRRKKFRRAELFKYLRKTTPDARVRVCEDCDRSAR